MNRWAGIKNNRICFVSSTKISDSDYFVVEVPNELDSISSGELMTNYRIGKDGQLTSKSQRKSAKELRIALVSNYGDKCGIATFSKFLFEELAGLVGDYKIFAEYNDHINLESEIVPQDKVIQCWERGAPLLELISHIKAYDPDIVLIQHEFGLWSNGRYWLSLLTQLSDYRVIVELHSTFPGHTDKLIFENAISEAIVHLQDAKDNLMFDKKLNSKIYLIGHGCYKIGDQNRLWNNYKSQHTFIQSGFGLKYKCFEHSIQAAAILKNKYPDIFFTALFSENPHNHSVHQSYYNELMVLINKLKVEEHVGIIRGFQSDTALDCYLRSNQVAVFPYGSDPKHLVFGSSGAVRLAFAAGLPTITSSIPHFSDTPSIKINTPEQIAEELDELFSSEEKRTKQIKLQNDFISANSWRNTACKYIDVFEGKMDGEQ
jgi:glycosyltransferase involved in cell wall biosynthesis